MRFDAQARCVLDRHRNAKIDGARCCRRVEASQGGDTGGDCDNLCALGIFAALKDHQAEQLADAVRRVHRGLRVIDPELATEAWGELDPLTDRERQVLRLAGDGKASGDIAAELGLSEGTVRNYLSEAISKLGAANRVEAARIARTKGWL